MSMQLFAFGHPCEHQLRRVCIGGTSCPLNGYPDTWCCSFVKGRINFKRDKPCEGQRCRWGFSHPTTQQFDAVHALIVEARNIAARIDDDTHPFTVTDPMHDLALSAQHPTDLALCAMHYVKTTQSRAGRRYGFLYALAAMKAGDAKVLLQLLRTCKKPHDQYLIGAWECVSRNTPQKGATKLQRQVFDELREEVMDGLTMALSKDGKLICREEQLQVHPIYVQILRAVPGKLKKRATELLEEANKTFPLGSNNMPTLPSSDKKTTPTVQPTKPETAASSKTASALPPTKEDPVKKSTTTTTTAPTKAESAAPTTPKAEVIAGSEPVEVAEDVKQKLAEAPALPPADAVVPSKKGKNAKASTVSQQQQQQPAQSTETSSPQTTAPAAVTTPTQRQARAPTIPLPKTQESPKTKTPTQAKTPMTTTKRSNTPSDPSSTRTAEQPPTVPTSIATTPSAVPQLGRAVAEEFENPSVHYDPLGARGATATGTVPDALILNGLFSLQPEGPVGSKAPLGQASRLGFSVSELQQPRGEGWRTPPAAEGSASWRGSQSDLASPFTPQRNLSGFSDTGSSSTTAANDIATADVQRLMEGVRKAWGATA